MQMELILVRHGESLGNVVTYDCPDPELTDLGRKQVKLLAKRLASEKFDYIYSSPLIRALETASAIAEYQPNSINVYTHLRENRGLEGVVGFTGSELKKRFPKVVFGEEIFKTDRGWEYPGGDTKETSYKRATKVANYIYRNFTGDERVLLTAHGGFNGSLMSVLLGLQPGAIGYSQNNTCINRFLIRNGSCKILSINDYAHLGDLSES